MPALQQTKPQVDARPLIEKMRGQSNYNPKRITGYAPFPHAALAEAARLADGAAFKLLMFILDQSLGRRVKETEPFYEITDRIKVGTLAEFCRCDNRTVTRELDNLKFRKVISFESPKKGIYIVKPLFRTWASLPDYEPAPMAEPPEPEDEDEPEPEPVEKEGVRTVVTVSPVHVRAGKASKPIQVSCGVSWLKFKDDVDGEFSAVVEPGGTLLVSRTTWNAGSGVNGLQNPKALHSRMRHQRPIPPSAQHPRAEELSALFDPLIHRWCGKTLSGDPQALLKACLAISDTPHDEVVKAAIARSERKLTPLHCEALCKEIAHNWEKGKGMMPAKKNSGKAPLTDPSKVLDWDPLWWQKEKEKKVVK